MCLSMSSSVKIAFGFLGSLQKNIIELLFSHKFIEENLALILFLSSIGIVFRKGVFCWSCVALPSEDETR